MHLLYKNLALSQQDPSVYAITTTSCWKLTLNSSGCKFKSNVLWCAPCFSPLQRCHVRVDHQDTARIPWRSSLQAWNWVTSTSIYLLFFQCLCCTRTNVGFDVNCNKICGSGWYGWCAVILLLHWVWKKSQGWPSIALSHWRPWLFCIFWSSVWSWYLSYLSSGFPLEKKIKII